MSSVIGRQANAGAGAPTRLAAGALGQDRAELAHRLPLTFGNLVDVQPAAMPPAGSASHGSHASAQSTTPWDSRRHRLGRGPQHPSSRSSPLSRRAKAGIPKSRSAHRSMACSTAASFNAASRASASSHSICSEPRQFHAADSARAPSCTPPATPPQRGPAPSAPHQASTARQPPDRHHRHRRPFPKPLFG